MNRSSRILFSASLVICLEFFGTCLRAQAQDRREVIELGKLKSPIPAGWIAEESKDPSIYRQFRLEAVGDDKYQASLTIQSLGKKSDTTAEKQVETWKAMFLPPERKRIDDVAKVRKLKVGGSELTYLDVRGDYKGVRGDQTSPRQNFRLLGVYFPTSAGLYLVVLFGPADTAESYRKGFEDWVEAFK